MSRKTALIFKSQLPKGDSTCCSHVERIDVIGHGNCNNVIAGINRACRQARPLCTKNQGQPLLRCQGSIIDGNRTRPQRHGCRFETITVQFPYICSHASPRFLENSSHAHAHRTAAQGIAARWRKEDRIYRQGSSRTEYSTYIHRIRNTIEYGHAMSRTDQFSHRWQHGTAQST